MTFPQLSEKVEKEWQEDRQISLAGVKPYTFKTKGRLRFPGLYQDFCTMEVINIIHSEKPRVEWLLSALSPAILKIFLTKNDEYNLIFIWKP